MALFSECMLQCARKVLDSADIVRDGDVLKSCLTVLCGKHFRKSEGQLSWQNVWN
jgi:hypothetical protein